MKVFISYSSKDTSVAEEILATIEDSGINCFYAPRDIRSGFLYAEEIMKNLEESFAVVLILSKNSNDSKHVLREVERAVSNNIPIIAYRIEEVKLSSSMEYFLMSNQWMDATSGKMIDALVRDLRNLIPSDSDCFSKEVEAEGTVHEKNVVWKAIAIGLFILWIVTIGIFFVQKNVRSSNAESNLSSAKGSEASMVTNGANSGKDAQGADESNIGNDAQGVNEANSGKDTQGANKTDGANGGDNADSADEVAKVIYPKLGDEISFGTYLDNEILWRVIEIDENGIGTLLSSYVLCMKGFEGAESGEVFKTKTGETNGPDRPFDPIEKMEAFGSNDWEKSSIRAWLNSDKEYVEYIGTVPVALTMCDHDNPYSEERGFLKGFSEEEREAIVTSEIKTPFYNPETGESYEKTTMDRVYLLSLEEVENLRYADVSAYTTPTEEALSKDDSVLYAYNCKIYHKDYSMWWLRTPLGDSFSEVYCVTLGYNEEKFTSEVASVGGMGVRPVIRVDFNKIDMVNY